jgi:hypothetical protein
MRIPQTPFEVTVLEALSVGVGLRLIIDPSLPVSLGLVAIAGAWALERIMVTASRLRQEAVEASRADAEKAASAASRAEAAVVALEGRLVRLETKEGWRTDGQGRR